MINDETMQALNWIDWTNKAKDCPFRKWVDTEDAVCCTYGEEFGHDCCSDIVADGPAMCPAMEKTTTLCPDCFRKGEINWLEHNNIIGYYRCGCGFKGDDEYVKDALEGLAEEFRCAMEDCE
jgi:hypothetical protein